MTTLQQLLVGKCILYETEQNLWLSLADNAGAAARKLYENSGKALASNRRFESSSVTDCISLVLVPAAYFTDRVDPHSKKQRFIFAFRMELCKNSLIWPSLL